MIAFKIILYSLKRYFGLKSLINLDVDSAPDDLVNEIEEIQIDVLLNPFAILICYYVSVIFLRDINKMTSNQTNRTNHIGIRLKDLTLDELNSTHIDDIEALVKRIYRFVSRHSNIASNLMMMVISNPLLVLI